MGEFIAMNVGQLKQLINDIDDNKPIRVWVERKNSDDVTYLEGRKLVGITDEPDMCCLCAMYYEEGD